MPLRMVRSRHSQPHTRTRTQHAHDAPSVLSFSYQASCRRGIAALDTRNTHAHSPSQEHRRTHPCGSFVQASPCSSQEARWLGGGEIGASQNKRPRQQAPCWQEKRGEAPGAGRATPRWWLRRSSTSSSSAPPSPSVCSSPHCRYHPPRSLRRCVPTAMQRVPVPPSPATLPAARPGVASGGFYTGRVGSRPRGLR